MPRTLLLSLALAGLASAPGFAASSEGDLGELAACVTDSGATYYGAHWCPMCRKQNAHFGEHADALPYTECYDGPKSRGINAACREAGVRAFPTWVLGDGRRLRGVQSPAQLAAATGCP